MLRQQRVHCPPSPLRARLFREVVPLDSSCPLGLSYIAPFFSSTMDSRQKSRSSRQRIKGLFKRPAQSPGTVSTTPPTTGPGLPTSESQTPPPASPAIPASISSPAAEEQTPQPTSTTPSVASRPPTAEVYGDRERTRERYKEASKLLQDAVKRHEKWEAFDFPELTGEPEGFNDSQFKNKINAVLQSRKQALKDLSGWKKCEHAIQCAFTAFSPFAKNFLTISKEAQQVQYGGCQC